MQLISIMQMRAEYWSNLQVRTTIDSKKRDLWVYYQLHVADTLQYNLNNIYVGIIKKQCSDKGESTQRQ